MGSLVATLEKSGLIHPPSWLSANIQYETLMGSTAYGVETEGSDWDIYGFTIPRKDIVFPHLAGEIIGFGRQIKRFGQFEANHINDPSASGGYGRQYDITIYSITKFFNLCMNCNPNMIDSLFTPERCVLHCTNIGRMVRDQRKTFLHRGAYHKFRGYSFSQAHKLRTKKPEGKRKKMVDEFGYDLKYAYHLVRLLGEIEQILSEGDLDLTRDAERLKSIRRGEWTQEKVLDFFEQKDASLEGLYTNSKLPWGPDEDKIKTLLLNCLEEHYGNLPIVIPGKDRIALDEVAEVLRRHRIV